MTAHALELVGLSKTFGALRATDDVYLTVAEHEYHAIIGPNGAGKTTLIGQITGELTPDAGKVRLFGRDVTDWTVPNRALAGLARSFQITQLAVGFSALDNVAFAVQARQGHSFRFLRSARSDKRLRDPALEALTRVGLEHQASVLVETLSHGERRQLELAIALAMEPRILLLDEPMAGMGPQESARLVEILASLKGQVTVLLVEHDMDAVFALADQVSVLVNGAVLMSGPAAEVRSDPRVRSVYLGDEDVPC
jgi:branched-chain amino acid transport system ATP-binding protein